MTKIDFVVLWVDGQDEEWLKVKRQYSNDVNVNLNTISRFRDMKTLKYWFRSVENNAPFVNKIHFVTFGHIPSWLNVNNKKLNVVKHTDFMPDFALPTFNSNSIEMCLANIKELSEHFVLFNDDMFLIKPSQPSDFFVDGVPKDYTRLDLINPKHETSFMLYNNMHLLNQRFSMQDIRKNFFKFLTLNSHIIESLMLMKLNFIPGFYYHHNALSLKKSTLLKLWKEHGEVLKKAISAKFRTNDDLTIWLAKDMQIAQGNFVQRNRRELAYFSILKNEHQYLKQILNPTKRLICINDDNADITFECFEDIASRIVQAFHQKYPIKSSFEI